MISWAWTPLIGIALCAAANAAMFTAARHARPEPVEERPWLRSAELDREKGAAERFAAAGFTLAVEQAPGGVRLALLGTDTATTAMVRIYRPNDRGADRLEAWIDPTQPLVVTLPHAGRWLLRLTAEASAGVIIHDAVAEVAP